MECKSESYVLHRIEYNKILCRIHHYWAIKGLFLAQPAENARYSIERVLR